MTVFNLGSVQSWHATAFAVLAPSREIDLTMGCTASATEPRPHPKYRRPPHLSPNRGASPSLAIAYTVEIVRHSKEDLGLDLRAENRNQTLVVVNLCSTGVFSSTSDVDSADEKTIQCGDHIVE
eukprot:6468818-Amphidinium_carterae.1